MKEKTKSPAGLNLPGKKNSAMKKNASLLMYDIPANLDLDALVLIAPEYLMETHDFSKLIAVKVAEAAWRICTARWPEACVRISNGRNIELYATPAFIEFGYPAKVSRDDLDMNVWDNVGARLLREIDEYLLIRACEDAGVRPPNLTPPTTGVTLSNLSDLLGQTTVPLEVSRLAEESAWNAGLLAGLVQYDSWLASGNGKTKENRALFQKALAVGLKKLAMQVRKRRNPASVELSRSILKMLDIDLREHYPAGDPRQSFRVAGSDAIANAFLTFAQVYYQCVADIAGALPG